MAGKVYELTVGGTTYRVDKAEVDELARAIRSGPEADLADQLQAAMGDDPSVQLGPPVDLVVDDPFSTPPPADED
jgi:hypothetical protein